MAERPRLTKEQTLKLDGLLNAVYFQQERIQGDKVLFSTVILEEPPALREIRYVDGCDELWRFQKTTHWAGLNERKDNLFDFVLAFPTMYTVITVRYDLVDEDGYVGARPSVALAASHATDERFYDKGLDSVARRLYLPNVGHPTVYSVCLPIPERDEFRRVPFNEVVSNARDTLWYSPWTLGAGNLREIYYDHGKLEAFTEWARASQVSLKDGLHYIEQLVPTSLYCLTLRTVVEDTCFRITSRADVLGELADISTRRPQTR